MYNIKEREDIRYSIVREVEFKITQQVSKFCARITSAVDVARCLLRSVNRLTVVSGSVLTGRGAKADSLQVIPSHFSTPQKYTQFSPTKCRRQALW